MALKQQFQRLKDLAEQSFNRTIMALKPEKAQRHGYTRDAFNRTIMALKLSYYPKALVNM